MLGKDRWGESCVISNVGKKRKEKKLKFEKGKGNLRMKKERIGMVLT